MNTKTFNTKQYKKEKWNTKSHHRGVAPAQPQNNSTEWGCGGIMEGHKGQDKGGSSEEGGGGGLLLLFLLLLLLYLLVNYR